MFEIGEEYRIWPLKEGLSNREGILLARDGAMLLLDVAGVQTVFHMAAVACAELVDREAEEARSKAAHAARMEAWS